MLYDPSLTKSQAGILSKSVSVSLKAKPLEFLEKVCWGTDEDSQSTYIIARPEKTHHSWKEYTFSDISTLKAEDGKIL